VARARACGDGAKSNNDGLGFENTKFSAFFVAAKAAAEGDGTFSARKLLFSPSRGERVCCRGVVA